ncbi:hypothetical protein EVAR_12026_1 [Eumeta japonica]|uniref:Uncharacterized protein n=1 Tax=Eumeta variegata TaxID=151549 RepID=A0A4C1U4V1_EUMVA|nr:hypothetical protein EVAR_12026_1 [Eumeta japonica]
MINRRWRLENFSWEQSVARRPFVHWCYIPEEFLGALIGDIVHPAGDVLDEFFSNQPLIMCCHMRVRFVVGYLADIGFQVFYSGGAPNGGGIDGMRAN